jgi:hypothetical protein
MDPLGGQRPPPDEPDDDEEDEDEYRAPSRRGILSGWRLAAAGVAAGTTREHIVWLHAHHAVEDPGHDTLRVAADLSVRVRRSHIDKHETQFAAEAALFPVARALLERLSNHGVQSWSVVVFAVRPVLAYGLVVWANIGHPHL